MSERQRLRVTALRLLAKREYSKAELAAKLSRQKAVNRDDQAMLDTKALATQRMACVAEVLDELEQQGIVSDNRFAEVFIRHRINQGYGPGRIAHDLKARGFDADKIANVLAGADIDWHVHAESVLRKRFGRAGVLEGVRTQDFKARAKQMRFLQYRGFSFEQINAVFRSDASE